MYKSKKLLYSHNRNLHSNMEFKCTHCDKTFNQKSNLDYHIQQVHYKKMEFPCSYCEKTFSSKRNKIQHELTHEGIKPFKCSKCEKAFGLKPTLLLHLAKIHQD